MTERGMKAKDLEPIIGSKGHVSSILSGRRVITQNKPPASYAECKNNSADETSFTCRNFGCKQGIGLRYLEL